MQARPNQMLSLKIETPNLGSDLKFVSVYEGKDKIIAIAKLSEGKGDSRLCDAIGECKANLPINKNGLHAKPVQYFVLVEQFQLDGQHLQNQNFTALTSLDSIKNLTDNMQEIFKLEEKKTHRRSMNH